MVERSSKASTALGVASTEWFAAKRERKIITKTDNLGPCSHEKIRSQAPDFFIPYLLFLSLG